MSSDRWQVYVPKCCDGSVSALPERSSAKLYKQYNSSSGQQRVAYLLSNTLVGTFRSGSIAKEGWNCEKLERRVSSRVVFGDICFFKASYYESTRSDVVSERQTCSASSHVKVPELSARGADLGAAVKVLVRVERRDTSGMH